MNILIPESETSSQNKNIHNPVPKTGDLHKSPQFIFSNNEKQNKTKTRFSYSVFETLVNTVCIIQSKRSWR